MKRLAFAGMLAALCICCGASNDGEELDSSESAVAIDMTIGSTYGVTVFNDAKKACDGVRGREPLASKWFVASSQRYGCHVHLRLTAKNGKCVVVSTEDAGPAQRVEKALRMLVMDVGPSVSNYLYGREDVGGVMLTRNDTYHVKAEKTSLPLGPCNASEASAPVQSNAADTPDDDVDDDVVINEPKPEPGTTKCKADWECNDDDSDGSGMICDTTQKLCVPGCRRDNQCPGIKTCASDGQCR